jgi:hypothetical protein
MQHLNHIDELPAALNQSNSGMAWVVNDRKYTWQADHYEVKLVCPQCDSDITASFDDGLVHCTTCTYQRPLSA